MNAAFAILDFVSLGQGAVARAAATGLLRAGFRDGALAFAHAIADTARRYARPSGFRAGVRDAVWEGAVEAATGRVRDPVSGRFMSRDKPWDMGHKPGLEFRKHQASAAERGIDRAQFLDEYNNAAHYRPELPSSNRSHRGENMTGDYFGGVE